MVKIIKGRPVLGRGGALVLLVILGGINRIASKDQYISRAPEGQVVELDSAISLLKQGDLVVRRGKDVASMMISMAGEKDHTWSHCGLVQIENGKPYVYHFIGSGNENEQGLHRDPAKNFFSARYNNAAGIMRYALSDSQLHKQAELIQEYYKSGKSFDNDFDLLTDDKLYCAEFVYKVMNAVKQDSDFIGTTVHNGFTFVPIDKLYAGNSSLIWQMRFK
jgi:hypothetical protein